MRKPTFDKAIENDGKKKNKDKEEKASEPVKKVSSDSNSDQDDDDSEAEVKGDGSGSESNGSNDPDDLTNYLLKDDFENFKWGIFEIMGEKEKEVSLLRAE